MLNLSSFGSVVFLVSVIFSLVSCRFPLDFGTLPHSIQEELVDNLFKKIKLEMELTEKEFLWERLEIKNYQFEVWVHSEPYRPPDSSGPIIVCGGGTNFTGQYYDDVKTIPLLFEDAKLTINRLGDLGKNVRIEYDETYYFPKFYRMITSRISYETNDENEVVSRSAVIANEYGYEVLSFTPLDDDALECNIL